MWFQGSRICLWTATSLLISMSRLDGWILLKKITKHILHYFRKVFRIARKTSLAWSIWEKLWITYHSLLKIHSLTKIIRVIQQRCFARNLTVLFAELKDKESSLTIIKVNLRFRQLRLNYINNWKKAKEEHLRLVTTAIRVGVIAKTDDEVYVLSIMKIYSYFSSVFSTEPKKFELLNISAVM